ncbi:MarR family winged helix-turn-helix transcriptional regulator [Roseateles sp. BYS78W]|uniref:MarR family winged helix-turn-helix transcriptional regulator n=1 Tax=Pelomonas candidula TaxID=3299025 RepID=A0ABW7HIS8_9BURK
MSSKTKKTELKTGPLESVIGYRIAKARVTTQALFVRHIGKPFSLRPVEFSLLMLLQANEAVTPAQLSDALSLSRPHLTLLLDRMQERGLIDRARSQVDRRSQQVTLTDAGQVLSAELAQRAPQMEGELQLSLSAAERAMLIELLDKVAAHGGPVPDDEA